MYKRYVLFDMEECRFKGNSDGWIFQSNDFDDIKEYAQRYVLEHPGLTTGDLTYRDYSKCKEYKAIISEAPDRKILSWKECLIADVLNKKE